MAKKRQPKPRVAIFGQKPAGYSVVIERRTAADPFAESTEIEVGNSYTLARYVRNAVIQCAKDGHKV